MCVATLVYFVGHMAGRINVDTVIELVSEDVGDAIRRLTADTRPLAPPPATFWRDGAPLCDARRGYLQELDTESLADWAAANRTAIRLLVRPGDYVFPGAPIAVIAPPVEGVAAAIRRVTALGPERVSSTDIEFAVRQLVEVAVRALSPGINDPHTAMSVLDRMGAALCDLVSLHLPSGASFRDDRPVLVIPSITYDGLVDSMFHMIRQNASSDTAVLIRLVEILTIVVSCERDPERLTALERHADLVLSDAERSSSAPADLKDLRDRHARFSAMRQRGPTCYCDGEQG